MVKRASSEPAEIPEKWKALLQLIPDYDSIATADGFWFDPQAAQDNIEFIETHLTHVEGELYGKPFLLEPWQKSIIANLFGWKDAQGYRRYRIALIYVARKNGKTPLGASIENCVFFCDKENGQVNYCVAADTEQALQVFRQVSGQITNNPELMSRCKLYEGYKAVTMEEDGSSFKVLSAEPKTKHGGTPHLIVFDELHAQADRRLADIMETSMVSSNRRQPLLLYLTTADFNRPSICNEVYQYACKVRDGIISDSRAQRFLPVIYELTAKDDWMDRKTWLKANPNYGVSVSPESIEEAYAKACEIPAYENTFKQLHLNIITQQDVRWLPMDKWDAIDAIVDENALKGQECYAGLDLASTTDIAALALLFPRTNGDYHIILRFWVPKEGARLRSRRDRVPYLDWINQGLIKATEGNVIDYDVIRADINELGKRFNIKELAIDRWNSTQLQTQLGGDGFEIVPFGQGFKSLSAPSKEFEGLILSGKLIHGCNPVLRWMADNVGAEFDAAGNVKPSKKKSTEKIDGIVAAIMALGRAMVREEKRPSVYETRGLVTVTYR